MSGPVRDKRFVKKIISILEDKKSEDIAAFDLKSHNPFVDYTMVATCANPPQMNAVAQAIAEAAKEASVEGTPESGWLIVDAGRVVVHLQSRPVRDFYRLDQLWENSPMKP